MSDYQANEIEVLRGFHAIRKRAGMYVGDVNDGTGLLNIVLTVFNRALREHVVGNASTVTVEVFADHSIAIEDDGSGMPVELYYDVPLAQCLLTQLHGPSASDTLGAEHLARYPDLVAPNALSTWLTLDIHRDGTHYTQRYERCEPAAPLQAVGPTARTGTRIAFLPDDTIFPSIRIPGDALKESLETYARLAPALTIKFEDGEKHVIRSPNGLLGYLPSTRDTFALSETLPEVSFELAAQWETARDSRVESFVNFEKTRDGGTHLFGMLYGMMDALEAVARRKGRVLAEQTRRNLLLSGMRSAIHAQLDTPQFVSPTRDRLGNPDVLPAIRARVAPAFEAFISEHPALVQRWLNQS